MPIFYMFCFSGTCLQYYLVYSCGCDLGKISPTAYESWALTVSCCRFCSVPFDCSSLFLVISQAEDLYWYNQSVISTAF